MLCPSSYPWKAAGSGYRPGRQLQNLHPWRSPIRGQRAKQLRFADGEKPEGVVHTAESVELQCIEELGAVSVAAARCATRMALGRTCREDGSWCEQPPTAAWLDLPKYPC